MSSSSASLLQSERYHIAFGRRRHRRPRASVATDAIHAATLGTTANLSAITARHQRHRYPRRHCQPRSAAPSPSRLSAIRCAHAGRTLQSRMPCATANLPCPSRRVCMTVPSAQVRTTDRRAMSRAGLGRQPWPATRHVPECRRRTYPAMWNGCASPPCVLSEHLPAPVLAERAHASRRALSMSR